MRNKMSLYIEENLNHPSKIVQIIIAFSLVIYGFYIPSVLLSQVSPVVALIATYVSIRFMWEEENRINRSV